MKQSLSVSITLAVFAFVFNSCRQQPGSPNDDLSSNVVTSPAHPALTYYGAFSNKGITSSALYVMDTDAKNPIPLFVAADTSFQYGFLPSWSPNGGSICFMQSGMGVVPDSIKIIDLPIDPLGPATKPSGRALIGLSSPGTTYSTPNEIMHTGPVLGSPFWSSTAAMGKVAYSAGDTSGNSLCVVSATGGTPIVLWSGSLFQGVEYCTWSPDDSRLACARWDRWSDYATIMIFNTSNWICVDSIHVNGLVGGFDWSRNGLDKLVFGVCAGLNHPFFIYYCDPKTGATPTTDGVVGYTPTWSPNNSSIIYSTDNGLMKVTPFARNTTVVSPVAISVNWKR